MALPSIATLLDFKIPQTNVIISEEETHSPSFVVYEKAIPKMLDVHEFVKFFETVSSDRPFVLTDDEPHLSVHSTIISPPPEA